MENTDNFLSIPIGSILSRSEDESATLRKKSTNLPVNLKNLITSAKTGAYLRGLVRTHNLPDEQAPKIAFAVLEIGLGEKSLHDLRGTLAQTLQIAPQLAQQIAVEIERDLFAPIALELNQYLAAQKKTAPTQPTATTGARNVLDLKNQSSPPPRPTLPPRPPLPPLPPLQRR